MAGQLIAAREALLSRIVRWAGETDHVLALVQTGSLTRADGLADQYSDLDLEIVTRALRRLEAGHGWMAGFADPIVVLGFDRDEQEWATRLAICDGGVKVDFTLATPARIKGMTETGRLDDVYRRGYRVLVDKSGLCSGLPAPQAAPLTSLPSQDDFSASVEEFWFEAFHVPRYLARGELFLVKQRDWTMKELLLEMIAWHAQATVSEGVDTWHDGKGIERWAHPEALRDLPATFGRYDADDAGRAFGLTVALYARLGRETAAAAGLVYPEATEARLLALLDLAG